MSAFAKVSADLSQVLEWRSQPPVLGPASSPGDSLPPGKPRVLPVEIDEPAFNPAGEVMEGPEIIIEPTRVIKRYTVRLKTADEVDAMRAVKVRQIKEEAGRRILVIMPAYKQTNWLARKAELDLTHGTDPANWPAEAQAEISAVLAQWAEIKAIRTRSDELEAALMALATAAEVSAFDPLADWT